MASGKNTKKTKPVPEKKKTFGKVNVSDGKKLRVRADISTESPIVKLLDNGEEIEILEIVNKNWYKINDGFVMSKFVEVI